MILETQKYLRANGLPALIENHKIDVIYHPSIQAHNLSSGLPLLLFSYNAIETRNIGLQYHEITRECRSLVLEKDTWNLVSRSFRRFFNLNEYKEETFDWKKFSIQEKLDGSLISVWYYKNAWRARTSGSFGKGKICGESEWTWESLAFSLLSPKTLEILPKEDTYVFELTSPYNQVVKQHGKSSLTLLSIFKQDGLECLPQYCDIIAARLCIKRPEIYNFGQIEDAIEWLNKQEASFEGFVLVDRELNRIKVKSPSYLRLHRLKNNNNGFLIRNLVPLIIEKPEEKEEILSYFTELKPKWTYLEEEMNKIFGRSDEILRERGGLPQKEFALSIRDEPHTVRSILFSSKKSQQLPSSCKKTFVNLLIKHFEGALPPTPNTINPGD